MIKAALELGRTVGLKPQVVNGTTTTIVSGRFIKFAGNDGTLPTVAHAAGTDAVQNIGLAADDTQLPTFNGMYEVIDNFYKNCKISAYILGGEFYVWNDGRGAVFANDLFEDESDSDTVVAGAPLYISASGLLTHTAGTTGTLGADIVGYILKKPATANDMLFFKLVK